MRDAADFKPPKSGPVQQLNEKVTQAKARIAARRERIAKLEKEAPASDQAAAQLADEYELQLKDEPAVQGMSRYRGEL